MSTGLEQMYAAISSYDKNVKSSDRKGGTFNADLFGWGTTATSPVLARTKMQIQVKVNRIYLAFETAE